MGYTHYFNPADGAVLDAAQFKAAMADIKSVWKEVEAQVKGGLSFEYDETTKKPCLKDNEIRFNGKGGGGHETFHIQQVGRERFTFCKTAMKPYDFAVCVCLTIFKKHLGATFDIGTDGGPEEWQSALDFVESKFKYGMTFAKVMGEKPEPERDEVGKFTGAKEE